MKKNIILLISAILIISLGITSVFSAQYSKFTRNFIKNFKDCDQYEETTSNQFQGQTFTSTKKIIGWRNGFCRYQEVLSSAAGKYRIDCSFSDVQLDELYEAMKSRYKKTETFNLELFSPQKDEKTGKTTYVKSGSTIIKGNKAYVIWAKYQNNPYFCVPEKL